jgi:hypothetical protein
MRDQSVDPSSRPPARAHLERNWQF